MTDRRVGKSSDFNLSEPFSLIQQRFISLQESQENSYTTTPTIQQWIERQSDRAPDTIAIECSLCSLSYGELNARANQLARYLQQQGVGPDVLVGLCLKNSLASVVACLAVLKAGGAYVPIDPLYPSERLRFILQDAHIHVLVANEPLAADVCSEVPHIFFLDAQWSRVAMESPENLPWLGSEHNLAYMIYTSGSTGQPKGVQIEHRSLQNLVSWHLTHFQVTNTENAALFASFAFDASVWGLWPYLVAGARFCVLPDAENALSLQQIQDWLIERGITIAFLPTPLAERIIELPWPTHVPFRLLLTGGDRLHHYPGVDLPFMLANNYGPTENTVVTSSCFLSTEERPDLLPPIGWPIAHTQIYILDQQLVPVPTGEPGELYIGGIGLARGYHHLPALTAASFGPDPFSVVPGARLYKTGDLACFLPNGMLKFIDRLDRQVKLRGYRFELGEVEHVLCSYPYIGECAVVLHHKNTSDPSLYAYVVWHQGEEHADAEVLQAYLRQKIPHYMVPSQFVFVSELPLTANGKVHYDLLPLPSEKPVREVEDGEEPISSLESTLCGIWKQILGLKQVGLHDNFFTSGGHSLSIVQFITHVRTLYSVNLLVSDVFIAPTIKQIALVIQNKRT